MKYIELYLRASDWSVWYLHLGQTPQGIRMVWTEYDGWERVRNWGKKGQWTAENGMWIHGAIGDLIPKNLYLSK